jgi:hypothetical protein
MNYIAVLIYLIAAYAIATFCSSHVSVNFLETDWHIIWTYVWIAGFFIVVYWVVDFIDDQI